MAIPWLTVLQALPWTEVIKTASKVADAAKTLWNSVAKRRAGPAAPSGQAVSPVATALSPDLASLAQGQAALAASLADLQGQMLASSELIKALADQNAQLIAHQARQERRMRWLSGAVLLLGGLLGWLLLR